MTEETNTTSTEASDKKSKVIGKINAIKSNIESFVSDINVNDLKANFNSIAKNAQKDFNRLVNKDLEVVRKKLQKEKADVEKKAKKFFDAQKKELNLLQAKFDKLLKAKAKLKAKAPAAAATKKKATKKVAAKKATKKTPARA